MLLPGMNAGPANFAERNKSKRVKQIHSKRQAGTDSCQGISLSVAETSKQKTNNPTYI